MRSVRHLRLRSRLVLPTRPSFHLQRRYYDEMNDLDHLMEMQPSPTKMKSKKKFLSSEKRGWKYVSLPGGVGRFNASGVAQVRRVDTTLWQTVPQNSKEQSDVEDCMDLITHEQADTRFDEILRRYEETMEDQVNARRQAIQENRKAIAEDRKTRAEQSGQPLPSDPKLDAPDAEPKLYS